MRTRIIGVAVLASVLATALFGVPLAIAVLEQELQQERAHLLWVAADVAISVAADVDNRSPIDPDDLTDLGYDGENLVAAVYDEDGDLIAGTPPADGARSRWEVLDGEVDSGRHGDVLVAGAPVTHSDEVIGAVLVSAPTRTVLGDVAGMWAVMAGLAALAVITAWLVGRWQARRLARPLEDLEESARRLGDGDFSVRSPRGGVAEIDSVGAALDSTAERLDDLLARERAFSADASHQLRTPLAGLRLRLEAALEADGGDPRAAIAASLVEADRLEATIDELLALARAGQAGQATRTDLGALLGELAPLWAARLALDGRDLAVAVDPGAPHAHASAAAIRQVLGVLLDNATVHGRGTVRLSVREAAGAVAIDVSDEGAGIAAPEQLAFDRPADRQDGHGVGLALARRLAQGERGRLELSSSVPPVFTLLLPAASHDHEQAGTAADG